MKWIMVTAMSIALLCGFKAEAQKVLVLYYSQTSNTKAVAQEIATKLNADIEEITLVNPYNSDYQATIERSRKEREQGITPEIKPLKANIAKYDVIFLGYPIWFGTYAPPIATWLEKVDLSGKTIVPFCTFGSGGLESSVMILKQKQPKAEIFDGYGVRAARMDAMPEEVRQFLIANGFLRGEAVKLEPFSAAHRVSKEDEAIFDAAVGDYPMISARALTVASRPISNGMEYLFTATEKRKGTPDKDLQLRPPKEMQVYVIVLNGQKPVFTKVVR